MSWMSPEMTKNATHVPTVMGQARVVDRLRDATLSSG